MTACLQDLVNFLGEGRRRRRKKKEQTKTSVDRAAKPDTATIDTDKKVEDKGATIHKAQNTCEGNEKTIRSLLLKEEAVPDSLERFQEQCRKLVHMMGLKVENKTLTQRLKGSKANPAKCQGSTQNNTFESGGLDCESEPEDGRPNNGSSCLDNLSNAQFYVSTKAGKGRCVSFFSKPAFASSLFSTKTNPAGQLRDGVLSKLTVAGVDSEGMYKAQLQKVFGKTNDGKKKEITTSHRNRYGVISGKRMVCTDSICHVFKVGMCIKCPEQSGHPWRSGPFNPRFNNLSNYDEFVKCCIMGGKDNNGNAVRYECDGQRCNCGEHYKHDDGSGAFTARNKAGATLKKAYQCWDGTEADADGKFAETQALGIIKVS